MWNWLVNHYILHAIGAGGLGVVILKYLPKVYKSIRLLRDALDILDDVADALNGLTKNPPVPMTPDTIAKIQKEITLLKADWNS